MSTFITVTHVNIKGAKRGGYRINVAHIVAYFEDGGRPGETFIMLTDGKDLTAAEGPRQIDFMIDRATKGKSTQFNEE